jgi:hypothetical protein
MNTAQILVELLKEYGVEYVATSSFARRSSLTPIFQHRPSQRSDV